jgi:hypothetical protein
MPNTRHTIYDATEAGGSATRNETRDPPPPPPPPYTAEQFITQGCSKTWKLHCAILLTTPVMS